MHRLPFKLFLLLILAFQVSHLQAQQPYVFKDIKRLEATPVKSQGNTGTCWCFSAVSFLESEAIRLGKGAYNLSEGFIVRHIYRDKCENYVRRQGTAQFSEGGLAHDVLHAVATYGIVPESEYPTVKDPSKPLDHSGTVRSLKALCDQFVTLGKNGALPANWLEKIDSVLDADFGRAPLKFVYNNTVYSPNSFRDFLGIAPENYVSVTSFTHHPFGAAFVLEVPDNFSNGTFFNLPLSDLMRTLQHALQNGFTVEWDADVSNAGFNASAGIAIVPDKTPKDKETAAAMFQYPTAEKNINQQVRQAYFDQQITQDDHLMHITGMTDEATNGTFYTVKNSWGEVSPFKGYVNVSDAYMRLNTLSFTLHKDALPRDIRQQLHIDGAVTPIKAVEGIGPNNNAGQGANTVKPAPNRNNGPAKIQGLDKTRSLTPVSKPSKPTKSDE